MAFHKPGGRGRPRPFGSNNQTGKPNERPMVRGKGGTYAPGEKEPRRTQKTGWNELTGWYAGWAKGGHDFHKHFAFPAISQALELKKGMRVIDIGSGTGALRELVQKSGAEYVGVDKSPSMIREAQKFAGKDGQFFVSDVTRPGGIALPHAVMQGKFDRAVFLFSIQDMDNAKVAIENAAKLIKQDGSVTIFMLHPAFRIPRMSGWGKDPGRKLTYRRVDKYKTEVTIPLPQNTGDGSVTSFFYHRPLQSYMDAITDAGLAVDMYKEIYSLTKGDESEFPHFLLLRARNVG